MFAGIVDLAQPRALAEEIDKGAAVAVYTTESQPLASYDGPGEKREEQEEQ